MYVMKCKFEIIHRSTHCEFMNFSFPFLCWRLRLHSHCLPVEHIRLPLSFDGAEWLIQYYMSQTHVKVFIPSIWNGTNRKLFRLCICLYSKLMWKYNWRCWCHGNVLQKTNTRSIIIELWSLSFVVCSTVVLWVECESEWMLNAITRKWFFCPILCYLAMIQRISG